MSFKGVFKINSSTYELQNLINSLKYGAQTTLNVNNNTLTILNPSRYVGVNTSSPKYQLDISGNTRILGAIIDISNSPGTPGQVLVSTGTGISWGSGSGSSLDISSTRNNQNYYITFVPDTSGRNIVYTNPNALTFNPSSNSIGIGKSIPAYNLDVSGNTYMSGQIIASNGLGSNGQVLTLNALGQMIWKDISGSSGGTANSVQIFDISANQNYYLTFVRDISGGNSVYIDSNALVYNPYSNYIGIGNPSPAYNLDVSGSTNISGNLTVDTNTLFINSITNKIGIGTITPSYTLDISTSDVSAMRVGNTFFIDASNNIINLNGTVKFSSVKDVSSFNFFIGLDNSNNIVRQDVSGFYNSITTNTGYWKTTTGGIYYSNTDISNVGIGTTSPVYRFDVSTNNSNAMKVGTTLFVNASNNRVDVSGSLKPTSILDLTNSSGNTNLFLKSTPSGLQWTSLSASSSQWTSDGSGNIYFPVNATDISNVGIGVVSPIFKLDVSGETKIRTTNIRIGRNAGEIAQQTQSIAIGSSAGYNGQGSSSIAIGIQSGWEGQDVSAIAIGYNAGYYYQKNNAVAIGSSAGYTGQQTGSIAIGASAGYTGQQDGSIAIGQNAGFTNQKSGAIAIGQNAGSNVQGVWSVAIGSNSGSNGQGQFCVALGLESGANGQQNYCVALGERAGQYTQQSEAVAVGSFAGNLCQGGGAIAIGRTTANNTQGSNAIAIGFQTARTRQGFNAIALGFQAGDISQGTSSIAIGRQAGNLSQDVSAIAIGEFAGFSNQRSGAIAIGASAGFTGQQQGSIAIGQQAGSNSQQTQAVSIGFQAAQTFQGRECIAIGYQTAQLNQGQQAVAIGYQAGQYSQGFQAVALGLLAGAVTQGYRTVAIGVQAGYNSQNTQSIAIGYGSGNNNQKQYSIALGNQAAEQDQQDYAIAIGNQAGDISQGSSAIAIGNQAGFNQQGTRSIAIGPFSGYNQSSNSIAIGWASGQSNQKQSSIAIGPNSGQYTQGQNAIAIGNNAGNTQQGDRAIAIGYQAGNNSQAPFSIILNASGTDLSLNAANSGLYVSPVRSTTNTSYPLVYDLSSKEIAYNSIALTEETFTVSINTITANTDISLNSSYYFPFPISGAGASGPLSTLSAMSSSGSYSPLQYSFIAPVNCILKSGYGYFQVGSSDAVSPTDVSATFSIARISSDISLSTFSPSLITDVSSGNFITSGASTTTSSRATRFSFPSTSTTTINAGDLVFLRGTINGSGVTKVNFPTVTGTLIFKNA